MAAAATALTSIARTFRRPRTRSRSSGFTLIEIMIVLAIVAALIATAAPRLLRRDKNVRSVVRHFIVMGKEVRNRARLSNSTMRLVIELDPQKPRYWVEKSSGPKLIDPEAEDPDRRDSSDDEDEEKPKDWQMDTVLTKSPKQLPDGLYFGSVETLNTKAPITEGTAYIHFFPEGLMEAAAVQLTDREKLTWTLVFNPLTGQADIVEQARSLKEIRR